VPTFHRKLSDKFENLWAIRANDLDGMFPLFREQLELDYILFAERFLESRNVQRALAARQARKNVSGRLPEFFRVKTGRLRP